MAASPNRWSLPSQGLPGLPCDDALVRPSRQRPPAKLRDNARRYASEVAALAWAVNGDMENVSLDGIPDDIADVWAEIEERGNFAIHDLDAAACYLGEIADHVVEILARRQSNGGNR